MQHGPSLKGKSVKERSVLLAIKGCINRPRNKLELWKVRGSLLTSISVFEKVYGLGSLQESVLGTPP